MDFVEEAPPLFTVFHNPNIGLIKENEVFFAAVLEATIGEERVHGDELKALIAEPF